MKLRNKKTGEIVETGREYLSMPSSSYHTYRSLAELNAEWEDVDEPKECKYWYIDVDDDDVYQTDDKKWLNDRNRELIGNYFETKEEAEKAVEKLKAWKRLKDKGFEFVGCFKDNTINYEFVERPLDYDEAEEAEQDLAFIFGGEE